MNSKTGADAYRQEAAELLAALERRLLDLEEHPADEELIACVFRALHTIKGSGSMFGFDAIAGFTHEIETVFDQVRGGLIPVTPTLIGVTLAARDHIHQMLSSTDKAGAEVAAEGTQILERLRAIARPCVPDPEKVSPPQEEEPAETSTYRIRFAPSPGILRNGSNPLLLFDELRQMGD